ncbi:MAG: Phenylacetic acid catabolic protein [Polyangiaceae bacterium]
MTDYPNPLPPRFVRSPEDFFEMPEEYRKLVVHQMKVHTEGEATGSDDYARIFYPMTKDPYEKMMCCHLAAEEMDHHLLGLDVLKSIGVDASYMADLHMKDRKLFDNEVVKKIDTWAERGFFAFIAEAAAFAQIEEFSRSSYQPIAEMTESILRDEKGHIAHGHRIVLNLCRTAEGKAEAQGALNRMWPATLDLFGRSDSPRSAAYVRWGLRQLRNNDARVRFAAATRPKLEKLGLTVPDDNLNRKFV